MKYFGITDTGKTRKNNQDSYQIALDDDGNLLAIVCDGVGGGSHGEIASSMAVSHVFEEFDNKSSFQDLEDCQAWLYTAINKANILVYNKAVSDKEYAGMGTTLVALLMTKFGGIIGNVGDSRAYALYNDNSFRTITTDHTYVANLVATGEISLQEALTHPQRHVITRAIGILPKVEVDFFNLDANVKSVILCSDGLYDYIPEISLIEIMKSRYALKNKGKMLVDLANKNGGLDNITLILVAKEGTDNE